MHNAALAHLGSDYVYVPLPVKPDALPQAIAGMAAIGVQGFNITIPHKQAIVPLLSSVTDVAKMVGAVNTVWWTEAGWSGTNTDVEGFLAPLKGLERNWNQSVAVILGNGGAARAVVAGCAQLGFGNIQVVGRDREKLSVFQQSWAGACLSSQLSMHGWDELPVLLPQTTLLVNTTPIGMHPKVDQSPLSTAEVALLPKGAIAYDLIYTPNPTMFLHQATVQGAVAIDGLEMLVQQGAAALQLWLQQAVPVDVMRRSLHQHLGWL